MPSYSAPHHSTPGIDANDLIPELCQKLKTFIGQCASAHVLGHDMRQQEKTAIAILADLERVGFLVEDISEVHSRGDSRSRISGMTTSSKASRKSAKLSVAFDPRAHHRSFYSGKSTTIKYYAVEGIKLGWRQAVNMILSNLDYENINEVLQLLVQSNWVKESSAAFKLLVNKHLGREMRPLESTTGPKALIDLTIQVNTPDIFSAFLKRLYQRQVQSEYILLQNASFSRLLGLCIEYNRPVHLQSLFYYCQQHYHFCLTNQGLLGSKTEVTTEFKGFIDNALRFYRVQARQRAVTEPLTQLIEKFCEMLRKNIQIPIPPKVDLMSRLIAPVHPPIPPHAPLLYSGSSGRSSSLRTVPGLYPPMMRAHLAMGIPYPAAPMQPSYSTMSIPEIPTSPGVISPSPAQPAGSGLVPIMLSHSQQSDIDPREIQASTSRVLHWHTEHAPQHSGHSTGSGGTEFSIFSNR